MVDIAELKARVEQALADLEAQAPAGSAEVPTGGAQETSSRIQVRGGKVFRQLRDIPMDEIIHELAYKEPIPLEAEDIVEGAEVQAILLPKDDKVPTVLRVTTTSEDGTPEILICGTEGVWQSYGETAEGLYVATVDNWMLLAARWAYEEIIRQHRIEFSPKSCPNLVVQAADSRGWRLTDPASPATFLKVCSQSDSHIIKAMEVSHRSLQAVLLPLGVSLPEVVAAEIFEWWSRPELPK